MNVQNAPDEVKYAEKPVQLPRVIMPNRMQRKCSRLRDESNALRCALNGLAI